LKRRNGKIESSIKCIRESIQEKTGASAWSLKECAYFRAYPASLAAVKGKNLKGCIEREERSAR
jgi:hypothetical protein